MENVRMTQLSLLCCSGDGFAQVMGFRSLLELLGLMGTFSPKRRKSDVRNSSYHTRCFSLCLHFIRLIFYAFCLFSLVSICPFAVLLTPYSFFSPLGASLHLSLSPPPLNPMIQPHSLYLVFVFALFLPYCSLVLSFSSIPPQLSVSPSSFSLLYCPLHFSPSVLFSSSSLLHHKVDGWMIHLSLCPRTVVILILLHS